MQSAVLNDIQTFGPDQCKQLSYDEACQYTQNLVNSQYENFTVVSWFLPKNLRPHFANIYAFCRWADDLGDETGDPQKSRELLAWWRTELEKTYNNQPEHPVFIALHQTIKDFNIPIKPFNDLILAFEQDQEINRYQTWEQVIDYCTRSADPVGRLVLYLCGYDDEPRQLISDKTCTALQLINFWQDVRRDIEDRNRIYVPADILARHNLTHDHLTNHVLNKQPLTPEQHQQYRNAIKECVDRTWPLFNEGRELWPLVHKHLRLDIQLFSLGGEAIMKRVEQINYDTINTRPTLGKPAKVSLMLRAFFAKITGLPLMGANANSSRGVTS